jgi:hypothetical protein
MGLTVAFFFIVTFWLGYVYGAYGANSEEAIHDFVSIPITVVSIAIIIAIFLRFGLFGVI